MEDLINSYFRLADIDININLENGFLDNVKKENEVLGSIIHNTYKSDDNSTVLGIKKDKINNTLQLDLIKDGEYSHKVLFRVDDDKFYAIKYLDEEVRSIEDLFVPLDESKWTSENVYFVKKDFKVNKKSDMEEIFNMCFYKDNIGILYLDENEEEVAKLLGNIVGYEDITKDGNGDRRIISDNSDIYNKNNWSAIGVLIKDRYATVKVVDQSITNVEGDKDIDLISITNYKNVSFDFFCDGQVVNVREKVNHVAGVSCDINGVSKDLGCRNISDFKDEVIATYPCKEGFSFTNINDIKDLVMTSIKKDIGKINVKEKN